MKVSTMTKLDRNEMIIETMDRLQMYSRFRYQYLTGDTDTYTLDDYDFFMKTIKECRETIYNMAMGEDISNV